MASEPFGFAAFRSRQQTTAFEAALKNQGVPCRVINTPHEIGKGCGLSVRFPLEHLQAAINTSDRQSFSALIGFFSVEQVGGRTVFKPVSRVMRRSN